VVDIGLMQHLNGLPVKVEMKHEDLLDIYRGKCAEQFVGQQWQEKLGDGLLYWAREQRGSSAEIDFLFQHNGLVIPIEVKSGKSGSLKSLHMFLEAFHQVEQGYVFYSGPYRVLAEQRVTFLPLYYAGNLKALN
jgi:predicted AAA+ superfamily ATPase